MTIRGNGGGVLEDILHFAHVFGRSRENFVIEIRTPRRRNVWWGARKHCPRLVHRENVVDVHDIGPNVAQSKPMMGHTPPGRPILRERYLLACAAMLGPNTLGNIRRVRNNHAMST